MIRGIGIDIVKVERINEKNVQKILSKKEKEVYDTFKGQKRRKEYAAGRFAVKESLIKCFKRFIPFSEITVLNKQSGEPYLAEESVKYLFEKFGGNGTIHISIAHEREYAVATAVVIDEE
ncbi:MULTISPECIES: holo-ACP synthase [Petrotoga]|uniref:Holo-[acyl-carrier-protein] synthase n=2 Tax=Petrotoga sibirica TaxID=156202 RepID=A0A4V6QAG3_9BACT|nr:MULTISPECIES: holo-ACP synthase [Petrotoga]POZ88832.1 ACP synthase [Petrotoga sibirica DSM 13575]POZ90950.1 ACP synthase [Petrotoga sp. SL27]TDX17453.1 holo-[acyl-carrier protein] synthase [Petrotoga sibirica]